MCFFSKALGIYGELPPLPGGSDIDQEQQKAGCCCPRSCPAWLTRPCCPLDPSVLPGTDSGLSILSCCCLSWQPFSPAPPACFQSRPGLISGGAGCDVTNSALIHFLPNLQRFSAINRSQRQHFQVLHLLDKARGGRELALDFFFSVFQRLQPYQGEMHPHMRPA